MLSNDVSSFFIELNVTDEPGTFSMMSTKEFVIIIVEDEYYNL